MTTGDRSSHGVITLNDAFNRCRHGLEVRDISARKADSGWLIWGHYSCGQCGWIALDHVAHAPTMVLIGGRKLPVLIT